MTQLPAELDTLLRGHCRLLAPGASIDPNALLTSLGVDSLEIIELIVALEDTFDISIPSEMLTPQTFATPATIWHAVEGLCAAGHSLNGAQSR
ncbi:phosphopantetheine-binding protein [Micromonospora sp. NPDC005652]|uniref:phosphopantetheine-binding protein n=1 Tax=Micromonospora sp. NPDC005652 TaxID=3157046 RepID=UPI0034032197